MSYYVPSLPLHVAVAASSYGVGAALTHIMSNGHERLVAFVSRTVTSTKRSYCQLEWEALAITFAVKNL